MLTAIDISKLASRAAPTESSHCKLAPGDKLDQFVIEKRLGRGRFATVWAGADPTGKKVAIKVYRDGSQNLDYYVNETHVLNRIFAEPTASAANIIRYIGTFMHLNPAADLRLSVHPCIVFELEGAPLSKLIRFCRKQSGTGLPLQVAKSIMRDILRGLVDLHSKNLIHTDIKPSNILLNKSLDELTPENMNAKIADLGSATPADNLFSHRVGTIPYIAPELILDQDYGPPVDVWAAFVTFFEMITGDHLFDVFEECDVDYGSDVDDPAADADPAVDADPAADVEMETNGGDDETSASGISSASDGIDESSSGGEEDLSEEKINYRHLLLIRKLLGPAPEDLAKKGPDYYTETGELKHHPNIKTISCAQLISRCYEMPPELADELGEFLETGLRYLPTDRITAARALDHPFLNN